jgi:hypothetical protein
VGLWINSFQPHSSHQPLHALAVDLHSLLAQLERHSPAAVERSAYVLLVDELHQFQILGAVAGRLVIEARTRQSCQFALLNDAQFVVIGFDPLPLRLYCRKIPDFF